MVRQSAILNASKGPAEEDVVTWVMQVLCSRHQPHLPCLWQVHSISEGSVQWCVENPGQPFCLYILPLHFASACCLCKLPLHLWAAEFYHVLVLQTFLVHLLLLMFNQAGGNQPL